MSDAVVAKFTAAYAGPALADAASWAHVAACPAVAGIGHQVLAVAHALAGVPVITVAKIVHRAHVGANAAAAATLAYSPMACLM